MKKIIQLGILTLILAIFHNVGARAQADSSAMVLELREYAIDHVQGARSPLNIETPTIRLRNQKPLTW